MKEWRFHTAPILKLRHSSGKTEEIVLDPRWKIDGEAVGLLSKWKEKQNRTVHLRELDSGEDIAVGVYTTFSIEDNSDGIIR